MPSKRKSFVGKRYFAGTCNFHAAGTVIGNRYGYLLTTVISFCCDGAAAVIAGCPKSIIETAFFPYRYGNIILTVTLIRCR